MWSPASISSRLLGIVSLFVCSIGVSSPSPPETSVVVGCIEYVHPRIRDGLREHEQRQFIVLRIERVLSGAPVPEKVLLGMELSGQHFGVVEIGKNMKALDQKVWKVGAAVAALTVSSDSSFVSISCFPAVGGGIAGPAELKDPLWVTRAQWEDPGLQRFQQLPVYCASVQDVYFLSKSNAATSVCSSEK